MPLLPVILPPLLLPVHLLSAPIAGLVFHAKRRPVALGVLAGLLLGLLGLLLAARLPERATARTG